MSLPDLIVGPGRPTAAMLHSRQAFRAPTAASKPLPTTA